MILILLCGLSCAVGAIVLFLIPQSTLDLLVYAILKRTGALTAATQTTETLDEVDAVLNRLVKNLNTEIETRLEQSDDEKPKREFVDHDGDHLEVVEFDKPKRGDFQ